MKKKSLSAKKAIHKNLLNYLKNPIIGRIYRDFENLLLSDNKVKSLAIAVSGGPDSLALTYLAKCFSILNNLKVNYYHLDHKLRKTSTKESIKLKSVLKKFDIDCKILVWKGKKPNSNIQSVARKKRYFLIINQILKDKFNHLLIAHHLDDLYENFLIRLLRGSGLKGLASFNQVNTGYNNKVKILRPLINVNKKDLVFLAIKIFNFYIKDPSNENVSFKRVRIRNLIISLKNEGFDEKKLKLTINNLSDSNFTINHYVRQNICLNSNYLKRKSTYILGKEFFEQPHEIVFRSLSNILKIIGKKYYDSRGKNLNQLLEKIKLKNFNKMTLSDCIIEKLNNSLVIYQETRKKR